jgi:hypothetical protein
MKAPASTADITPGLRGRTGKKQIPKCDIENAFVWLKKTV